MDGKARALDNVFVERFWRTIKYEDIYLKEYKDGKALFEGLLSYIQFYNFERKHQSLLYLTPMRLSGFSAHKSLLNFVYYGQAKKAKTPQV